VPQQRHPVTAPCRPPQPEHTSGSRRIDGWAPLSRPCAELLDRVDYLLTLARLTVDWLGGPPPETPTDRAIREEGQLIRKALPWLDERWRGHV
jgi:hypothetical protein